MSLKTVMHPETMEVITIDTNKEPGWMFKYLHRITWQKFDNPVMEEVVEAPVAEVIEVTQPTEEVVETPSEKKELTLEEIQALYLVTTGKEAPARYKNNPEWLLSKING